MELSLFICMLFALQAFYWIIGRASSKDLINQKDYFLAGKSVPFFPLMMTFVGVIIGGGIVLGSAEEAYLYGWWVYLYPLGSALGMMALGTGIGKLAKFEVATVAQICEVAYGSSLLKKIASCLSMLSLFMILVGQIIASSKFLVSLGVDNTPLFLVFWAIVIVYTVQGGLKAVISTDVAQASLFAVVLVYCFGYVLYFEPGATQLPPLSTFALPASKLAGWLLMPFCFMVIEQDIAQRCFAGSSAKIVSRAAWLAGLCTMVISVIPIFFGVLAQSMQIDVPAGGSVLMSTIIKTTNPLLSSLVGCAVLAAIISTATALINAIGSNLFGDFNLASAAGSMRRVRLITGLISCAAIAFAFCFSNIVEILIQSYELSASCLFVPIFAALFKRQNYALSAWLAVILGACGFIFGRFYAAVFPKEIVGIALSLLGFISGEIGALFMCRCRCKIKAL